MNNTILKKVIDALNEEQPKLDYIRGMLETLYELESPVTLPQVPVSLKMPEASSDEASILDAKARAALSSVREMEAASRIP